MCSSTYLCLHINHRLRFLFLLLSFRYPILNLPNGGLSFKLHLPTTTATTASTDDALLHLNSHEVPTKLYSRIIHLLKADGVILRDHTHMSNRSIKSDADFIASNFLSHLNRLKHGFTDYGKYLEFLSATRIEFRITLKSNSPSLQQTLSEHGGGGGGGGVSRGGVRSVTVAHFVDHLKLLMRKLQSALVASKQIHCQYYSCAHYLYSLKQHCAFARGTALLNEHISIPTSKGFLDESDRRVLLARSQLAVLRSAAGICDKVTKLQLQRLDSRYEGQGSFEIWRNKEVRLEKGQLKRNWDRLIAQRAAAEETEWVLLESKCESRTHFELCKLFHAGALKYYWQHGLAVSAKYFFHLYNGSQSARSFAYADAAVLLQEEVKKWMTLSAERQRHYFNVTPEAHRTSPHIIFLSLDEERQKKKLENAKRQKVVSKKKTQQRKLVTQVGSDEDEYQAPAEDSTDD